MYLHRKATRRALLGATALAGALSLFAGQAGAQQRQYDFDLPAQPLDVALREFARTANQQLIFADVDIRGLKAPALSGSYAPDEALQVLLAGTDLHVHRTAAGVLQIAADPDPQSSGAAGDGAEVEALIVTAQKREEDIQDVPIAISAFTQEALERSQVAGGPDLMTQVPNMTFTKTNFSSYSIQIRGIGTQAISATTDPGVAVAFNNTPFIRNRFFEQEFYDLQRVEVLRGPQGTLYGRNATAGVVNIISQKPTFGYEAKLVADVSNYSSTRLEGMLNIPLAEDKVALRLAGAWTKREGYTTNEITGNPIDGRDLWSTRLSLRVAPTDWLDVNLIWEHFQENDDRLRSGKQLCHQDNRDTVGGLTVVAPGANGQGGGVGGGGYSNVYSQGCLPASLYGPESFEAPNGYSLPYFLPLWNLGIVIDSEFNPYSSLVQSRDLRVIESTIDPKYRAKSDIVELQWSADLSRDLTLTSETSYLYDTIFSLQDFNRFNTAPGAFKASTTGGGWTRPEPIELRDDGYYYFCDPQLGCANRLVAMDVSRAKSSHFSQEFRLASDYDGPFNFSLGANFLRYDTEDKYYVFINTLSLTAAMGGWNVQGEMPPWVAGVSDNRECLGRGFIPPDPTSFQYISSCIYIDPNPVESVNDLGHNYFLSRNPYKLISYAAFGEAYYQVAENLKVTAGLRWTVDKKEAPRIPSWLLGDDTVGYSILAVEEQEWREPTGRITIDWKPDLSFTDETLLYASYAHGYKAGGSNPPPTGVVAWGINAGDDGGTTNIKLEQSATKPKTFEPEFVNSFEVGAKNTLLDGRLTMNMAAFYYDYEGYQVSQIIDRSAVNFNFDSRIWGLELEADWRPRDNLRLGLKGGYENTRVADGERAIDIMDRTAGKEGWLVVRPFPTFPSNCVLPTYVFDPDGDGKTNTPGFGSGSMGPCEFAYTFNTDPVTRTDYGDSTEAPTGPPDPATYPNYIGYNPKHDVGQNYGEGFFKELGGNELPNAPHFTATITADYTLPLPHEWLATLHTDLYYQSEAWTRVFNTEGYDKLKAFTNVNVAAIFTNEQAGWKVMAYVKNVFDKDNITGAFLNSDDTGLTTNVFLVEPRLYGLRVTKEWSGGPWWTGSGADHQGPYPLTIELSGSALRQDAPYESVATDFATFPEAIDPAATQHRGLDWGDGREIRVVYRPGSGPWKVTGALRYGRSNSAVPLTHLSEYGPARCIYDFQVGGQCDTDSDQYLPGSLLRVPSWSDSSVREQEDHVIADFSVGRDFGVGLLGVRSTVSAGLRKVQFDSVTATDIRTVPDLNVPEGWILHETTRHIYDASAEARRGFDGFGPTLSWEAASHLFGNDDVGHLDLEWSVTAGVLFGKQDTAIEGMLGSTYQSGKYLRQLGFGEGVVLPPLTFAPLEIAPRSESVTVPVVDLSAGLSYEVGRFKVGAGYRWERYFDVLDAGYRENKDADRTIDGPYFKIAVGFGG